MMWFRRWAKKQSTVLFQLPPNFYKDTLVLGNLLIRITAEYALRFKFRSRIKNGSTIKSLKHCEKTGCEICIADTEKLGDAKGYHHR